MATSKSIPELVTDALEASLAEVTRANGFTNTLEVHRETKLGLGPAPTDANDRYTTIVPGELIRHDGSDPRKPECMNADDYDQVFWLDCYGFESNDSAITPDAVNHSIAADVIKQVNADYTNWLHPDNDRQLVLYPTIRFAMPMELTQSQYRGVILRCECLVRTRKFDPHHLP